MAGKQDEELKRIRREREKVLKSWAEKFYFWLSVFLLLSLFFPWPILFIAQFIDFTALVLGMGESVAWSIPVFFLLVGIVGVSNIMHIRKMVNSMLDNFMLVFLSILFGLPIIGLTIVGNRGLYEAIYGLEYSTELFGALLIPGLLGFYLMATHLFNKLNIWEWLGVSQYKQYRTPSGAEIIYNAMKKKR